MEARGTNTIFMPPLRCSVLSSAWRSSAALRPPAASASLKREGHHRHDRGHLRPMPAQHSPSP